MSRFKSYNGEINIEGSVAESVTAIQEPSVQNPVEDEKIVTLAIEDMKIQASQDVNSALKNLEKTHAGVSDGVASEVGVGVGVGVAGSIATLSSIGTVAGLSSAGVTSGLMAAGGIISGGMLVGIGVLATPVAVLGAVGYSIANRRKKARKAAALGLAIKKICDVQARLIEHEEHFKNELAQIKTTLEVLTQMKTV